MVMHHDGGGGGVGSLYYSDILFSLPQASDALYKVTLMDWLVNGQFCSRSRTADSIHVYYSALLGAVCQ